MHNGISRMVALIFACLGMVICGAVRAATITKQTDAFRLSIKHDGVRQSMGDETLAYSPLWEGDAVSIVTIKQKDNVIAESLTEEGYCEWSASRNGTYEFTHTTYTNGVVAKVEQATFVVIGKSARIGSVVYQTVDEAVSNADEAVGTVVEILDDAVEPKAEWLEFFNWDASSRTLTRVAAIIGAEATVFNASAATDADAAIQLVKIVVPVEAQAIVDNATYAGYFKRTAELENDNWVVTVSLDPEKVLPDNGKKVAEQAMVSMLSDNATSVTVSTKPGLYYWIAGTTDLSTDKSSYTPGTAVLGTGAVGGQEIARPLLKDYKDQAFYILKIDTNPPTKNGQ